MTHTYVGLADCHGVQALGRKDEQPAHYTAFLQMRSRENEQRHGVVFQIRLTEEQAGAVEDLRDSNKPFEALILLKTFGEPQVQTGYEGRWNVIPNHMLDNTWEGRPKNESTTGARQLD